jgi:hypothetical protein
MEEFAKTQNLHKCIISSSLTYQEHDQVHQPPTHENKHEKYHM